MTDLPNIADEIEAIKDANEEYFRDPEALEQAKAIWKPETSVNKCGVFEEFQSEIVAQCGKSKVEVGVCRVRDGVFVHCCSLLFSDGSGFGYAPNVWHATPWTSFEEARTAGIQEVLARLRQRRPDSQAGRAEMLSLRSQLEGQVRQRSLF